MLGWDLKFFFPLGFMGPFLDPESVQGTRKSGA
jgi:hypothetical protein